MKLKKISVKNLYSKWNVKGFVLDDYLSLLVGASGVGKTQILRAIKEISNIAKGKTVDGLEWDVTFEFNGMVYQWKGKFDVDFGETINYSSRESQEHTIVSESLLRNSDIIIHRVGDQIKFNNTFTVKLDSTKSVIALLKEEDDIRPIYEAFCQVFELDNENNGIRISPFLSRKRDEIKELREIHNNRVLTPIEKLFLLRKEGLPQFETIKDLFINVFPIIEDIDFSMEQLFDDTLYPVLRIKERGVDNWIMQHNVSSGMYRTLSQITFLVLAEDGDIILIDEFENGLGVNCINQLAEQILDADKDIQFIITSHHPYIINSIPFKKWKIIIRECSDVKVMTTDQLKIGEHSRHEAFMQLIQTDAYRKGRP